MTYDLEFDPRALKQWEKLGATVKEQFKTKLINRLTIALTMLSLLSHYQFKYRML